MDMSEFSEVTPGLAGIIAHRPSPATLLAVGRPGKPIELASRGDAGDAAAPDLDTSFRIASCTKSFTAARVLQLRDAGLLELDDPVGRHLPVMPRVIGESQRPITLRAALSMSAGLPTDDAWADRQESIAPEHLDALGVGGIRTVRAPGSGYEYSNLGYALLGRVCEHIDGRTFTEQVRAELILPLGLGAVTFAQPSDGRVATGHAQAAGRWCPQPVSAPGAFSAIGGLFASAAALLRWSRWLLAAQEGPGRTGDGETVLSSASRREMQRPHALLPAAGPGSAAYGFGLVVELDERLGTVISHSGGYPGFSSHMRWHPESGIVAVGFENARYSGVTGPVSEALAAAVQAGSAGGTATPPWPETQSAVAAVGALLANGSAASWRRFLAEDCDPVVELDDAPSERWRRAIELLGGAARSEPAVFPTAARAEWDVEGPAGRARVAIELSPLDPPRIQRLELSSVGAKAEAGNHSRSAGPR